MGWLIGFLVFFAVVWWLQRGASPQRSAGSTPPGAATPSQPQRSPSLFTNEPLGPGSGTTAAPPPPQPSPSRVIGDSLFSVDPLGLGTVSPPPDNRTHNTGTPTPAARLRPPTRVRPIIQDDGWDEEDDEDSMPFAAPGKRGSVFTYGRVGGTTDSPYEGPYAVIDFETTGLSPTRDRIIEVAIARVDANGRIEDEFATLINPQGRDVGPTFIHGITNDRVRNAPEFNEVIDQVLTRLSDAVVVAHNASFEDAFLAEELRRAGIKIDRMPALCTLWLGQHTFHTPNHKLGTLARAAGVPLVDKHAALGDVRAVSALLPRMLTSFEQPISYKQPLRWRRISAEEPTHLVTRAVALRKGTDGWMHSLVSRLPASGLEADTSTVTAYLDAMTEAMSDGKITGDEAKHLANLAGSAGLGGAQVLALNTRFLDDLYAVAMEDEVLSVQELKQLNAAAKALSLPDHFRELQPTPTAPRPVAATNASATSLAIPAKVTVEPDGDRFSRGRTALEMQRAGAARDEIADALGVTTATVKNLLRDAKFLENPQSDPSRLMLALSARQARERGTHRDQFQVEQGLSTKKTAEAWRDAISLQRADSLQSE